MKRVLTISLLMTLLLTGSAHGAAAPESVQGLAAGVSLMGQIMSSGATTVHVDGGWCRPIKRSRWRCRETVNAFVGIPVECHAFALVSKSWWRYPPEWFGCPAEWRPH